MNRESDFQVDGVESHSASTNILKVIWQRKGFVVLGALLGLAVGFLFHTQKSAVYASNSQVLISQTVKDLVAGSGLTFRDAGEHELKGVPDRWHVYIASG